VRYATLGRTSEISHQHTRKRRLNPRLVFDLDQCSFLFISAFYNFDVPREVMTMQSNNKGDSLTDNLWAEMTLMMVLLVIVPALAWRYVW
jgi:hypothetical protein